MQQYSFSVKDVKDALTSAKYDYHEFQLDSEFKLLVVPGMGRVFGPYKNDEGEFLSWVNHLLSTADGIREFETTGQWNYGGDRLWVAPEFPFFTKQRAKFNETYTVQTDIDPASYVYSESPYGFSLDSVLSGMLFESAYPSKKLQAKRDYRKALNPLRRLKAFEPLMEGVEYTGFTQTISLKDLSPEYPMELAIWNLLQLPTAGTYYLPYLGNDFDYVDYYSPSEGKILQVCDGHAEITVDSVAEHKIGLKSAIATGRIGYLRKLSDGQYSLTVRNYFNDPSDYNLKEPSTLPGENGCSQFIYMNDQRCDGFTELECSGRWFGGHTGRDSDTMVINYWYFVGEESSLRSIMSVLLGI